MTFRFHSVLSTLALALSAGGAFAGGLPACGEQPFFEDSVAPATLTRAEVVAAAMATRPAAGEMSSAPAPEAASQAQLDRASVVAELRDALDHGHRPASGEVS